VTGRDRLLTAFHGGTPDTVPFSPNLYYWFYTHLARGTLPPELAGASHPFDALRALGADILARWDTQHATRDVYRDGDFREEFAGESPRQRPLVTAFNIYSPGKTVRRRRFETPWGALTHTWTLSEDAGADFESEYWWKNWSQYRAVRFLLESRDYEWNRDLFRSWVERVGSDGLVMVHVTQSPLKTFFWLAGPAAASLFLADHPAEMRELAAIHESKALALLERIVDDPLAEVFISLDNLDSDFYSPRFYRDYCASFFRRAAEIVHSRNKIFVVHACGRNRVLMPLVGSDRIDCLEGLTPPTLGNVTLCDARRMSGYENFVVNGGMDTPHLELREGAERAIDEYTRTLFAGMPDLRRFIFASSCTTPVVTPWDNLKLFAGAAREHGRLSGRRPA
jgi:hypothetical protein